MSYPGYAEAEWTLRKIAADTGAVLLGSFDPKQIPCLRRDFFGGMHPKGSCKATLLKRG